MASKPACNCSAKLLSEPTFPIAPALQLRNPPPLGQRRSLQDVSHIAGCLGCMPSCANNTIEQVPAAASGLALHSQLFFDLRLSSARSSEYSSCCFNAPCSLRAAIRVFHSLHPYLLNVLCLLICHRTCLPTSVQYRLVDRFCSGCWC